MTVSMAFAAKLLLFRVTAFSSDAGGLPASVHSRPLGTVIAIRCSIAGVCERLHIWIDLIDLFGTTWRFFYEASRRLAG
jgi:hypothetical protein